MTDYLTSRPIEPDVRVRTPQTPRSARFVVSWDDDIPVIEPSDSFHELVAKFIGYINKAIDAAYSYEQLRTTYAGQSLKPLILRLSNDCHHPAVVAALLAAKYVFQATDDEGTGLSESRGLACEIVGWQFLTCLSDSEMIDYILYEIPSTTTNTTGALSALFRVHRPGSDIGPIETTPLLETQSPRRTCDRLNETVHPLRIITSASSAVVGDEVVSDDAAHDTARGDILRSLAGMNAMEVAGIASAKKFLSQRTVQKIVDDIWNGDVIFWESLSVEAIRQPRAYNKRLADPFTRLRVPRYQKAFEIGFFVSFLVLFYTVLVGRPTQQITLAEALLYWWIASFAYDEFGEIRDAGLFYGADFWSIWDIGIIGVSIAFLVIRVYGKMQQSDRITGMAFDVLSMVALFLIPRMFSVMSLNPFFGSLIPVLKEMTKALLRFSPVVLVLFFGFLTTFSIIAREHRSLSEVSWVLVKVFFGGTDQGFDNALTMSPLFGFPLMLIFVCLTNIVLITSLVSLVSNSLTEVMTHARIEYLFQYSIYVLESSSSRRLTYFMPPLNLISLLLLRPLRLVLPTKDLRRIRILVLKATHVGFVALIWAYEGSIRLVTRVNKPSSTITRDGQLTTPPLSAGLQIGVERYARRPWPVSTLNRTMSANAPRESASVIAEPDVLKLLQRLSTQVDELSALISEQRMK